MRSVNIAEPTYLRGMFLNAYFLADVLFSRFCKRQEMREIYDKYADIFLVKSRAWLDESWEIISSDLFALADNTADFNRLFRLTKQYPECISDAEEYILSQKASAVQIKSDILLTGEDVPFDSILRVLERRADGGDTDCISLLGFLEYHGIFFPQNVERAKKRFKTAALWNHPFSILMGAAYTTAASFYHKKLCALLHGSSCEEVVRYLQEALPMPPATAPDRVALALEHAFCQGTLQACRLNTDVMKVMCSAVLSENEKYKLVKTAREKESFSPEIPLNASRSTEIVVDLNKLQPASKTREAELEQIRTNLSMIDLRASSVYRPLLVICEDELVLDFYRETVKSCFASSALAQVTLSDRDKNIFSHSEENVFLSALDKAHDRNVVLLIDRCELLGEEGALELASYLKGETRKRYKTASTPSVEIDLSGILPILFATERPESSLLECCDVLLAGELSREEFRAVLTKELDKKKGDFVLSSLTMETDVPDFLYDYSSDTVMALVNKAIAQSRLTESDVSLTVPMLAGIIDRYYKSVNRSDFWRNTAV